MRGPRRILQILIQSDVRGLVADDENFLNEWKHEKRPSVAEAKFSFHVLRKTMSSKNLPNLRIGTMRRSFSTTFNMPKQVSPRQESLPLPVQKLGNLSGYASNTFHCLIRSPNSVQSNLDAREEFRFA